MDGARYDEDGLDETDEDSTELSAEETELIGQILSVQLGQAVHEFENDFEEKRRHLGRSHGVKNDLLKLSKLAVYAVKVGDLETARTHLREMSKKFEELKGFNLPEDQMWVFTGEAGQEYVEAAFVFDLYPYVFEDEKFTRISDVVELRVRPQTYLAGLADVPGELARILNDRLTRDRSLRGPQARARRIELRDRFLEVSIAILDILDEFETSYQLAVGNSRYRGFRNTLRGMIGTVRSVVERNGERQQIDIMMEI